MNRRLFFALWPDEKTREQLQRLSEHHVPDHARPVKRENLHATLAFLGDQPESILPELNQAAIQSQAGACELILDHLEVWKRSQILSLCPSQVPDPLTALYGALKQRLGEAGLETETRPYRPHVTLARKVKLRMPLPEIQAIEWWINEFVLVESVIGKQGATYQVLERYPLG